MDDLSAAGIDYGPLGTKISKVGTIAHRPVLRMGYCLSNPNQRPPSTIDHCGLWAPRVHQPLATSHRSAVRVCVFMCALSLLST